jgi:hypothetical protein
MHENGDATHNKEEIPQNKNTILELEKKYYDKETDLIGGIEDKKNISA